jgi:hypothetical protein
MIYAVEMSSCGIIFLLSFVKIYKGLQAILRFYLSNLNGCNVGITSGSHLWSPTLKWVQVA